MAFTRGQLLRSVAPVVGAGVFTAACGVAGSTTDSKPADTSKPVTLVLNTDWVGANARDGDGQGAG